MIVKSILKEKARGAGVVTVTSDAKISEAAGLLAQHRIGALLVIGAAGAIAGILSERDIIRGVAERGNLCLNLSVRDLMTAEVVACHESDTIEALMQIMTSRRIRHLPVVGDEDRLVGIVTIGDVVKSRLEEADMEVDNLRHYVVAAR